MSVYRLPQSDWSKPTQMENKMQGTKLFRHNVKDETHDKAGNYFQENEKFEVNREEGPNQKENEEGEDASKLQIFEERDAAQFSVQPEEKINNRTDNLKEIKKNEETFQVTKTRKRNDDKPITFDSTTKDQDISIKQPTDNIHKNEEDLETSTTNQDLNIPNHELTAEDSSKNEASDYNAGDKSFSNSADFKERKEEGGDNNMKSNQFKTTQPSTDSTKVEISGSEPQRCLNGNDVDDDGGGGGGGDGVKDVPIFKTPARIGKYKVKPKETNNSSDNHQHNDAYQTQRERQKNSRLKFKLIKQKLEQRCVKRCESEEENEKQPSAISQDISSKDDKMKENKEKNSLTEEVCSKDDFNKLADHSAILEEPSQLSGAPSGQDVKQSQVSGEQKQTVEETLTPSFDCSADNLRSESQSNIEVLNTDGDAVSNHTGSNFNNNNSDIKVHEKSPIQHVDIKDDVIPIQSSINADAEYAEIAHQSSQGVDDNNDDDHDETNEQNELTYAIQDNFKQPTVKRRSKIPIRDENTFHLKVPKNEDDKPYPIRTFITQNEPHDYTPNVNPERGSNLESLKSSEETGQIDGQNDDHIAAHFKTADNDNHQIDDIKALQVRKPLHRQPRNISEEDAPEVFTNSENSDMVKVTSIETQVSNESKESNVPKSENFQQSYGSDGSSNSNRSHFLNEPSNGEQTGSEAIDQIVHDLSENQTKQMQHDERDDVKASQNNLEESETNLSIENSSNKTVPGNNETAIHVINHYICGSAEYSSRDLNNAENLLSAQQIDSFSDIKNIFGSQDECNETSKLQQRLEPTTDFQDENQLYPLQTSNNVNTTAASLLQQQQTLVEDSKEPKFPQDDRELPDVDLQPHSPSNDKTESELENNETHNSQSSNNSSNPSHSNRLTNMNREKGSNGNEDKHALLKNGTENGNVAATYNVSSESHIIQNDDKRNKGSEVCANENDNAFNDEDEISFNQAKNTTQDNVVNKNFDKPINNDPLDDSEVDDGVVDSLNENRITNQEDSFLMNENNNLSRFSIVAGNFAKSHPRAVQDEEKGRQSDSGNDLEQNPITTADIYEDDDKMSSQNRLFSEKNENNAAEQKIKNFKIKLENDNGHFDKKNNNSTKSQDLATNFHFGIRREPISEGQHNPHQQKPIHDRTISKVPNFSQHGSNGIRPKRSLSTSSNYVEHEIPKGSEYKIEMHSSLNSKKNNFHLQQDITNQSKCLPTQAKSQKFHPKGSSMKEDKDQEEFPTLNVVKHSGGQSGLQHMLDRLKGHIPRQLPNKVSQSNRSYSVDRLVNRSSQASNANKTLVQHNNSQEKTSQTKRKSRSTSKDNVFSTKSNNGQNSDCLKQTSPTLTNSSVLKSRDNGCSSVYEKAIQNRSQSVEGRKPSSYLQSESDFDIDNKLKAKYEVDKATSSGRVERFCLEEEDGDDDIESNNTQESKWKNKRLNNFMSDIEPDSRPLQNDIPSSNRKVEGPFSRNKTKIKNRQDLRSPERFFNNSQQDPFDDHQTRVESNQYHHFKTSNSSKKSNNEHRYQMYQPEKKRCF